MFVEGFEGAYESAGVLEGYSDSVVYMLEHFVVLAHRLEKMGLVEAAGRVEGLPFWAVFGGTCNTKIGKRWLCELNLKSMYTGVGRTRLLDELGWHHWVWVKDGGANFKSHS